MSSLAIGAGIFVGIGLVLGYVMKSVDSNADNIAEDSALIAVPEGLGYIARLRELVNASVVEDLRMGKNTEVVSLMEELESLAAKLKVCAKAVGEPQDVIKRVSQLKYDLETYANGIEKLHAMRNDSRQVVELAKVNASIGLVRWDLNFIEKDCQKDLRIAIDFEIIFT